jgi:thioredoxin-dependent peroxiredoxin
MSLTPGLTPGSLAPAFRLARTGGGTVSLSDFAGRKLVLFFFPRAGTTGCTREATAFSALAGDFKAAKTAVLGISTDPAAALERFAAKHALAIPLACDPSHAMPSAYGAWGEKTLYGKTSLGVIRTTVLIDRAGVVVRVWPKVRVEGHAEAVLAATQAF